MSYCLGFGDFSFRAFSFKCRLKLWVALCRLNNLNNPVLTGCWCALCRKIILIILCWQVVGGQVRWVKWVEQHCAAELYAVLHALLQHVSLTQHGECSLYTGSQRMIQNKVYVILFIMCPLICIFVIGLLIFVNVLYV